MAGGRPKLEFDLTKVAIFGQFKATSQTMADYFKCSLRTIAGLMADEESEFLHAYKSGLASAKMRVSEAQLQSACKDRNASMLIWLGKQLLGQRDNNYDLTDKEKMKVEKVIYKTVDKSKK